MELLFVFAVSALAIVSALGTVFVLVLRTLGNQGGAGKALAGVFAFLGLIGLGTFGLVSLGTLLVVFAGTHVVENGPVRSVELLRTDAVLAHHELSDGRVASELDPAYPLHLLVTCDREFDVQKLGLWLEARTDGHVELIEARRVQRGNQELLCLDFGIDVPDRDVERFEREFAREVPFFDLPEGIRLELKAS